MALAVNDIRRTSETTLASDAQLFSKRNGRKDTVEWEKMFANYLSLKEIVQL